MTEKEKIAQIIAEHMCPQGKAHKTLYGAERKCYSRDNFAECEKVSKCVDALIAAGIGGVSKWETLCKVLHEQMMENMREERHRTEVTEWALRAVSFRLTRMCYPECPKEWERLMIECEDHWKWQAEHVIAKKQAEKKISEEKR